MLNPIPVLGATRLTISVGCDGPGEVDLRIGRLANRPEDAHTRNRNQ